MITTEVELDRLILAAHERGDARELAELYQKAANIKRETGEVDAAGFLLTQAYVFALECSHPDAAKIRVALAEEGRELSE